MNTKVLLSTILGFVLNLTLSVGPALAVPADTPNSTQAFQRLTGLVGRWEAITEHGNVQVTYELIASGSVLLERIDAPGLSPMVTTYHLDGDRLVLEHYCHAGNQPRMQAKSFKPDSNELDFDFLTATNLPSPSAGHMHQLTLRFASPDELLADWTWIEGATAAPKKMSFDYHRVK
jgi:hypothetical protein